MAKISVYSVSTGDDIRKALEEKADWICMDFTPESPRFVSMMPTHAGIIPDRANDDLPIAVQMMPKKMGVFADEMPQNIVTRVVNYQLDIILLNGNETPTLLRNLRRTLDPDIRPGIMFIKRIGISSADNVSDYSEFNDCVDYFLFPLDSEPDQCGAFQGCDAIELNGIDSGRKTERYFIIRPTRRQ